MLNKENTKRLKDTHDLIAEYVQKKKAVKVEEILLLIPADMRFAKYELDFTETYDTGRSDPTENAGIQKTRKDIIAAGMASDGIGQHVKYSNTTNKLKQYMTKYFPSECNAPFEGFIRLSLELECPASSGEEGMTVGK